MKRRLEIARALIHDSRILLLDEPTVGLDAQTRERIWAYVHRLRAERQLTVLVTTHYIEEVEGCDRVCIIDRGRILADDTPEALKRAHGQQLLRVLPQRRRRPRRDRRALRPTGSSGRRADEIVLRSDGGGLRRERSSPSTAPGSAQLSVEVPSLESGVPRADRPRAARPGGGRARARRMPSAAAAESTPDERRRASRRAARGSVAAARRALRPLAARGEARDPRPRPAGRRHQPADPLGADPRHRAQPLFPRRGVRRGRPSSCPSPTCSSSSRRSSRSTSCSPRCSRRSR